MENFIWFLYSKCYLLMLKLKVVLMSFCNLFDHPASLNQAGNKIINKCGRVIFPDIIGLFPQVCCGQQQSDIYDQGWLQGLGDKELPGHPGTMRGGHHRGKELPRGCRQGQSHTPQGVFFFFFTFFINTFLLLLEVHQMDLLCMNSLF